MVRSARATRAEGASSDEGLIQLLSPSGERVANPDFDLEVTDDEARGLYRDMVIIRRVDLEATSLQRQGQLALWASLRGQEAAQIGAGRALARDDFCFPGYREHGFAWCRGISPLQFVRSFRQVTNGGWDPYEFNFAEPSIVIGNNAVNAVGYAMGVQHDGAESAVMACIGDGAMSQGDIAESFVWASVFQAPIVFLLQNNHWAISEPTERQSRIPLFRRAEGFGFPGLRVDGNDVFAMLAVTRARARPRPRGLRPDAARGLHLSHGRAHDVGRPHAVPRGRRGGGVASARPDRAAASLPHGRTVRPMTPRRRRSTRRRTPWRASCARTVLVDAGADAGVHLRPRLRRGAPVGRRGARPDARAPRRRGRREPQVTELHTRQGHQRGAPQGDGGQREGPAPGRGHRQARRGLPRDGRAAEGFRRAARHRLAARRVRRSWARRSASRSAGTAPSPRSSSTGSCTRRSTSSSPRWPSSTRAPRVRSRMSLVDAHPVRRRHRCGRAPLREPRGLLRPHRRACASSRRRPRMTATG